MQSGIFLIASGGDCEYEIMRVSDGKALLRITLNRIHGLHEYVVLPDQERDVIKFYQWYPFNVPEEKRVVVSELMTFLTWGKAMAAYQMDVGDGSIGWRSTIFVRDADFASERPTQVFVALMHATDDNWRAILSVIYGDKPAKPVYEEAQQAELKKDQAKNQPAGRSQSAHLQQCLPASYLVPDFASFRGASADRCCAPSLENSSQQAQTKYPVETGKPT